MSVPSLASFQGIQANAAPQFVGIFLVWALFGVLSTQTYLYFKTFSNDRIFLKTLVYTVYTLQMAQTILLTRAEWKVFVTGFGDLDSLGEVWAAWIALCVIGGIVTFLVQLFYAYRIYVLSQNAFVSGIITLASLTSLGGALAVAFALEKNSDNLIVFKPGVEPFQSFGMIWMGFGTTADVMIVTSMCHYLHARSSGSIFRRTHDLISKIIRLTVETGALTASLSIIFLLISYIGSPSPSFEAPLFILAGVYSTTLMVVLNSRMKLGIVSDSATWLENELTAPIVPHQALSGLVFNNGPTSVTSSTRMTGDFEVQRPMPTLTRTSTSISGLGL